MKMSDVFKELDRYKTITSYNPGRNFLEKTRGIKLPEEIEGISITPEFLLKIKIVEMSAIEHAVNNHDALVESLAGIINTSSKGEVIKLRDQMVNAAILLDKIKGESDENN